MLTVYKYDVPNESHFSLVLPLGAKILTVQTQDDKPQIWALVNSENPVKTHNFLLVTTGDLIKEDRNLLNYIGTFQQRGGSFIGHLFELS